MDAYYQSKPAQVIYKDAKSQWDPDLALQRNIKELQSI